MDSEISMKAVSSAKRKRVDEAMDLGQGDDRLKGTDRMLTDVAMVPPILVAGIKSTGYKSKRSDCILTGATLEMEILSQCGESTMKDFKPSPMNYGKRSVVGQLVSVEYNRMTLSETVSVDEPAGAYMEMLEYRNSARGHLMALKDKRAMEGYLETMMQGTTLKQRAYGTLASSEMQAETIEQLVSLPWKAVACAKGRDALCSIRFMIEQISVPALSTCVKMLREGDERPKALLLLALLDMHQSKPMRVNMKEPVELEPMRKIDKIRRFSNKELRLTKESMRAMPKSSENCGPIRKKSYSYVSGIIGIAYNPFLNEDIRDCFFDYEQAVLLRFWTSRFARIRSAANQQAKLGLVLEEKLTTPSVPESDK